MSKAKTHPLEPFVGQHVTHRATTYANCDWFHPVQENRDVVLMAIADNRAGTSKTRKAVAP